MSLRCWGIEVFEANDEMAVRSTAESTAEKQNAPEKYRERFFVAGPSCDCLLSLPVVAAAVKATLVAGEHELCLLQMPLQPALHAGIDNDTFLQVRFGPANNGLSDLQRRLYEPASLVVVPVSAAGGSATGWSREVGRVAVSNIGE